MSTAMVPVGYVHIGELENLPRAPLIERRQHSDGTESVSFGCQRSGNELSPMGGNDNRFAGYVEALVTPAGRVAWLALRGESESFFESLTDEVGDPVCRFIALECPCCGTPVGPLFGPNGE